MSRLTSFNPQHWKIDQDCDFLIFSSDSGARYLYDAATASVHSWHWSLSGEQTSQIFEVQDADLESACRRFGASPRLKTYILAWRDNTGAFRREMPDLISKKTDVQCKVGQGEKSGHTASGWQASPSIFGNLMLVITDACNLRCTYCIFSGQYPGFKTIRARVMSWETAKAAVDRFFELNALPAFRRLPDRKLDISFFGGEPLLRGDLIRKVVAYAEARKEAHYRLHFSMTTNLTSLPDDMAEFLVEHGIGLECSIDGPKAIHDRHRVDAAGRGSFDSVMHNLKKLRSLDRGYFEKHVRATVTLNKHADLLSIYRFFDAGNSLIPSLAYVGFVRQGGAGDHPERGTSRFAEQYFDLLDIYLERKRKKLPVAEGSFLYHYMEEPIAQLYGRLMSVRSSGHEVQTGMCRPGRRIAVSTDGKCHICERINEHFPIGDVSVGIDPERCRAVIDRYYQALPDCYRCWARLLCINCAAQICAGEQFVLPKSHCQDIRRILTLQLIILHSVLEVVPNAYSFGDPLIDGYMLLETAS